MSSKNCQKNISLRLALTIVILFCGVIVLLVCFYQFIIPKNFEKEVETSAVTFELAPELLYAIIRAESNYRPDAISNSGAQGLMQIMPSTARFIAEMTGFSCDLSDPSQNIRAGAWYLAYLSERFDGMEEILAAYNAGEGKVRGWLRDSSCSSDGSNLFHIPYKETESYVKRVIFFYKCYKIFY